MYIQFTLEKYKNVLKTEFRKPMQTVDYLYFIYWADIITHLEKERYVKNCVHNKIGITNNLLFDVTDSQKKDSDYLN